MNGDIKDPRILKLKGVLFLALGLGAGTLLLLEAASIRAIVLLPIAVWAFCRFYYFAFYVLHHYADPDFKYAGLIDLARYLARGKRGRR